MTTNNINEKRVGSPVSSSHKTKWGRGVGIMLSLHGGILFVSSGRLDWGMAWVYLIAYAVCILAMSWYMAHYKPELLAERAHVKPQGDVARWDVLLSTAIRVLMILMLMTAGLDRRYGSTPELPLGWQLLALVVGVLGYMLILWALASNNFASTFVRIQDERGHKVATSGPYRYVRHPFYVGVILFALAAPLALGSLWALLLGILMSCLFILRTALEDRKLSYELDGYSQYVARVHYRLLPGVW